MNVLDRLKALRDGRTGSTDTAEDPFVDALRHALSDDQVRYDGAHRALLSHDASVFEGGNSGPVCYPASTAEVQAIVSLANEYGRNVVPRGAGTGLAGGAIPLGVPVVVALTKMNRILEVDTANRYAWVEPGVINLDLTKPSTASGLSFRPRSVEPTGLHPGRQRRQQLGWPPLPRLRRDQCPRYCPGGRVALRGGRHAGRPRSRATGL